MTSSRHPELFRRSKAIVRSNKTMNCAFEPEKLLILITNRLSKHPKITQKTTETYRKTPTKTRKNDPEPKKNSYSGPTPPGELNSTLPACHNTGHSPMDNLKPLQYDK
jgi:hypothetical protein